MKKYRLQVKNDLLYLLIILTMMEFFNYSVLKAPFHLLAILGILGLLVLETWFIRVFAMYSGRKVSKYSDVIIKASLRNRFFGYFILPAIFYFSLLVFLYFNRNIVLGHTVLGVCTVLLMILFLNVKSSLNKFYSLAVATRAIFDFICITIYYLLLNSFVRFGTSVEMFLIFSFVTSFILLIFVLKIHDRIGFWEVLLSFLSSIIIASIPIFFWDYNIFVIPAMGALAFYLIISIWNIRFAGKIKFIDYIVPFLYVAMAVVLILNF